MHSSHIAPVRGYQQDQQDQLPLEGTPLSGGMLVGGRVGLSRDSSSGRRFCKKKGCEFVSDYKEAQHGMHPQPVYFPVPCANACSHNQGPLLVGSLSVQVTAFM